METLFLIFLITSFQYFVKPESILLNLFFLEGKAQVPDTFFLVKLRVTYNISQQIVHIPCQKAIEMSIFLSHYRRIFI